MPKYIGTILFCILAGTLGAIAGYYYRFSGRGEFTNFYLNLTVWHGGIVGIIGAAVTAFLLSKAASEKAWLVVAAGCAITFIAAGVRMYFVLQIS